MKDEKLIGKNKEPNHNLATIAVPSEYSYMHKISKVTE